MQINADGAYLLGLIAADGHVQIELDSNGIVKSYKVTVNCGSDQRDEPFAHYVTKVMEEVLECPATCRLQSRQEGRKPYWAPITYRKAAVEWVLARAPKITTHEWEVPECVRGDSLLLGAWLSGFSDGDGSVRFDPPHRSVSLSSANREGLVQVQALMNNRLGVQAAGPYERQQEDGSLGFSLNVGNRAALEAFRDKIGFRSARKRAQLAAALESYKRAAPNLLRDQVVAALPQVLERRARSESFESIASAMGFAGAEIPKGMIKRAAQKAGGSCIICVEARATHSVPRVVRGRAPLYVCEPCLEKLEPRQVEWSDELVKLKLSEVADFLDQHHYLGRRGARPGTAFALRNKHGVLVFSQPMSAALPREWLELSRWCVASEEENAGSRQWASARDWLLKNTDVKTLVSYSDPSEHDGAIYRASGWLWAPSSQYVLKNLRMAGERHPESPYVDKNRWVFPLRQDESRSESLTIRHPWLHSREDLRWLCEWIEPRWNRRGSAIGGGKDFSRWKRLTAAL